PAVAFGDGVEQIVFDDGTAWNRAFINANAGFIRGTAAAETLACTQYDDTLVGSGGDDTLLGGGGNDTYVYASGDGNDLIQDVGSRSEPDSPVLSHLNLADVTIGRSVASPNDLLVLVNATGETVTVKDHFLGNSTGLEQIQFANGTIWNRSQILAAAVLL